jgi:hypothetical protein
MSWLRAGICIVLAESKTDKYIRIEKKEEEEEETPADIKTTILHAYTVQEIHVKCFNTFFCSLPLVRNVTTAQIVWYAHHYLFLRVV